MSVKVATGTAHTCDVLVGRHPRESHCVSVTPAQEEEFLDVKRRISYSSAESPSLSDLMLTYYVLIYLAHSEISMFQSRLSYVSPFVSSSLSQ